ncbi:extracellular solute-binding protein [Thalassomonas viridans]|uniref:Extracellular solute-binding protein n=1 Tax=Thalassomonas viridans TaxID=137584 RepID=A0AAE9Z7P1_9GAMM|nr:PotD/PotF family extracellular solute-binding protein [Thalassomonas viridans]WDE07519.1 extracellular solute-binding protein [Thalassomonas viridans]
MWRKWLLIILNKPAHLVFILASAFTCIVPQLQAKETLRIFTWDGYVTEQDLIRVNRLLSAQNYDIEAKVITPFADDADQMFNLIRAGKADVAFLTLFFIKMKHQRMLHLLQPIDTQSPRLSNYKALEPSLTDIPMGMVGDKKFYIPWGGGAYGFYVDRNRVEAQNIPISLNDLWQPKWRDKVSYNLSQEWYNIGITLMSMGKSPFYINKLVREHRHAELIGLKADNSELMGKLTRLYANAGHLWHSGPVFHEKLHIVSSWGPEIMRENNKGSNWQLIRFKEGSMVWLDTINFVHSLKGKKLEAAEIFANYFIGKQVQNRIVNSLSMVAASSLVDSNPLIDNNPAFFQNELFVPPYDTVSGNVVTTITERALLGAQILQKRTNRD